MLLILCTLLGLQKKLTHKYEESGDKSDRSALVLLQLWKFAISAGFMVFAFLVPDYIQYVIKTVHKTCDDSAYFTQSTTVPFPPQVSS